MMANKKKLDGGQRHVMQLIARDVEQDGWTTVSKQLYPHLLKSLPSELVEFEPVGEAGRARLTEEGDSVLNAMGWI